MVTKTLIPPHNIDAEESIIGSIILDGDIVGNIAHLISIDDFYSERNRWLFEGCLKLYERREKVDQITLAQELNRAERLERCGGASWLSHLVSITPTPLDAEYYADIVKRLAINRRLILLAHMIDQEARKQGSDTNKTIDSISELFRQFKENNLIVDDLITPQMASDELLKMVIDYSNPQDPIYWGFRDLDDRTGGIYPELTVIGARPSIGKSELMLNVVENIRNKKILYCSAEMSIRGILERKVARQLQVDILTLRKRELTSDQLSQMSDLSGDIAGEMVYHLPPGVTSRDIYNRVEKMKETIGIDIVFVDYLQILKDCWETGRDSRYVRVGQACKVLKGIVNDFNIPVICASQLNRDIESRPTDAQKPRLSDLRESGDIEQDSDNVLLLWRDLESKPEILEVKVAKGRQIGASKHIDLVWLPDKRKYGDAYKEY